MTDFLEKWDPTDVLTKKSFIMTLLGNKRMGKSYFTAWFLEFLGSHNKFDLVVSFCGSVAANPDLQCIMSKYYDDRFMFPTFSVKFLRTLLEQQESIKSQQNRSRNVLLIIDDVEIESEAFNYLGFLATRHRHYSVSIINLSVRFSYVHKSVRSCSDYMVLFNIPTYSDRQMLLKEHATNPQLAKFCMGQLEKYQALIIASDFKQRLYVFRCGTLSSQKTRSKIDVRLDETKNLDTSVLAESSQIHDEDTHEKNVLVV